jgi:molecular chaperone HtpG
MERKQENTRWVRVDADTINKLIEKDEPEVEQEEDAIPENKVDEIKTLFETVRPNENYLIQTAKLGEETMPVIITRNEFMRRMRDQAAMGGGMDMLGGMPESFNVAVNLNHPLVKKLQRSRKKEALAKQLLDLGMLSQNLLSGQELTRFIQRSLDMIG